MEVRANPLALDLRQVIVQVPNQCVRLVQKAAQVLVEEVAKRTRIQWPITAEVVGGERPVIRLGVIEAMVQPADGFQIRTQLEQGITQINIIGNDARGLLFGVGYLLRHLQMSKDRYARASHHAAGRDRMAHPYLSTG